MSESGVFLRRKVIESKAFKELTKIEIQIYLAFLLKRRFGKRRNKKGGSVQRDIVVNNGEIVFTYSEAMRSLDISSQTFQRAIDKFIKVGLIDIIRLGQGGIVKDSKITGEASLYAISDRWEDYGTDSFIKKTRKRDNRKGRGWAAYHAKRQEKNGN